MATTDGKRQPRKPARRTNEARSAETRKALIEATIGCLCALGYARTTTLEISRRAKITSGALQHHFGKKDELIIAALDALMVELAEVLERFEGTRGNLPDRIAAFVDLVWGDFYSQPRYAAVWEIVVGSRAEPRLHKRVARHRETSIEKCEAVWRRAFGIGPNDQHPSIEALYFALSYMRGEAILPAGERRAGSDEARARLLKSFILERF